MESTATIVRVMPTVACRRIGLVLQLIPIFQLVIEAKNIARMEHTGAPRDLWNRSISSFRHTSFLPANLCRARTNPRFFAPDRAE